jgi:hypothetical protein
MKKATHCKNCGTLLTAENTARSGVRNGIPKYRAICKPCDSKRCGPIVNQKKKTPQGKNIQAIRSLIHYATSRKLDAPTMGCYKYCIDPVAINRTLGIRPAGFCTDHIIPLAWFDLSNQAELVVANSVHNLQYLTPAANDEKGVRPYVVTMELSRRPHLSALWNQILEARKKSLPSEPTTSEIAEKA